MTSSALLIVLFGVLFAFAGQFAAAGDAALLRVLAPELGNAAVFTRREDLDENRRRVLAEKGTGFKFEGDFNGDGRRDMVLLGQYGNDRPRSFVLIVTGEGNEVTRSALMTFQQEFVVGKRSDNGSLSILFCVSCDAGGRLEWTGSQYVLRPFPPVGVQ